MMKTNTGVQYDQQKMREALERLRAVVIKRNRAGMEWGEQFDDLMTALGSADEALALQPATNDSQVTVLPDGSAFGVMSFPLPEDHWLYAPREYSDGADEPKDLPQPILTHALRAQVVAAVRYAVRGATMCGKETDFDPDALVQNAVYALCGPFTSIERAREAIITRKPAEALAQQPVAGAIAWATAAGFQSVIAKREGRADNAILPLATSPGGDHVVPVFLGKQPVSAPTEFIRHQADEEGFSEWVQPKPQGYFMKCCDCGLVHEMESKVVRYRDGEDDICDDADDSSLAVVFRMRRADGQQPVAGVELTGEEMSAAYDAGVSDAIARGTESLSHYLGLKFIIAAHEAKKNGGGV